MNAEDEKELVEIRELASQAENQGRHGAVHFLLRLLDAQAAELTRLRETRKLAVRRRCIQNTASSMSGGISWEQREQALGDANYALARHLDSTITDAERAEAEKGRG